MPPWCGTLIIGTTYLHHKLNLMEEEVENSFTLMLSSMIFFEYLKIHFEPHRKHVFLGISLLILTTACNP
jgi:hypothetical protein